MPDINPLIVALHKRLNKDLNKLGAGALITIVRDPTQGDGLDQLRVLSSMGETPQGALVAVEACAFALSAAMGNAQRHGLSSEAVSRALLVGSEAAGPMLVHMMKTRMRTDPSES